MKIKIPGQASSGSNPPPAPVQPPVTRQANPPPPRVQSNPPPLPPAPPVQEQDDDDYNETEEQVRQPMPEETANENAPVREAPTAKKQNYILRVILAIIAVLLVILLIIIFWAAFNSGSGSKTGTVPIATQVTPVPTVTAMPTETTPPPVETAVPAPPVENAPKQVCVPVTADLLRKFFFQNDPSCMVGKVGKNIPERLTMNCNEVTPYDEARKCTDVSQCVICLPEAYAGRGTEKVVDFNVETLKVFSPQTDPSCFVNPHLETFHQEATDGLRFGDCASFSYDPVRGCYDYSSCKLIIPALAAADPAKPDSPPAD